MQTKKSNIIDLIEETLIALILAAMTLITFANVVMRKLYNDSILWALESTVFLFAWLVLLGASYAVKHSAHLGVDALTNALPRGGRRFLATIAAIACLVFSFLLLKGAWDYWANFANLPQTTGRWFPTGFEDKFRLRGWFEVPDIPMPEWLRFIEPIFNNGDKYEKIPRFIPYFILPLSMTLMLFRFMQVSIKVFQGNVLTLVASHEVEDQIEDAAKKLEGI